MLCLKTVAKIKHFVETTNILSIKMLIDCLFAMDLWLFLRKMTLCAQVSVCVNKCLEAPVCCMADSKSPPVAKRR